MRLKGPQHFSENLLARSQGGFLGVTCNPPFKLMIFGVILHAFALHMQEEATGKSYGLYIRAPFRLHESCAECTVLARNESLMGVVF